MTLLAIDASTKSTGIAIFNQNNKLCHYECITIVDSNVYKRILKMKQKIVQIYKQYNPTDIIMQDVLPQDINHNQSVFKALIYLQAAVVMALSDLGVQVQLCPASRWRSSVGIHIGPGIKRNELKTASVKLVKSVYNIDVNDDISDAICLGMAYIMENKKKSAF